MSSTKNNLMDNIEQGLVRYNPATREYEPTVAGKTDSELAGQTIGESRERLRRLLENYNED